MEKEIRKDIKWYEWLYQVSDLWNIKSLWKQKWFLYQKELILKPLNINNYWRVVLVKDKIKTYFKVNRLVAQAFLGLEIENKNILVCHKSEQLNNNWLLNDSLENLFLWSSKDNTKDMINKKRSPTVWIKWKDHMQSVRINQYSLFWNFIKTWDCLHDIQRELWIYFTNVWKCCNWKRKTAWWFTWEYFKENLQK